MSKWSSVHSHSLIKWSSACAQPLLSSTSQVLNVEQRRNCGWALKRNNMSVVCYGVGRFNSERFLKLLVVFFFVNSTTLWCCTVPGCTQIWILKLTGGRVRNVSSPDGGYLLLYLTRKNPLRFKISFTCKWDSLSSEVIDRRRESFFLMLIWGHLEWYADFTVGSWGSKWYYKMIHVITSKLKKSENGYSQEFML